MWRAIRTQVLPPEHMIAVVDTAAEARDRGCWRKRRIFQQGKVVAAVVVGEREQGVHNPRERVTHQPKGPAEAGSFGRREMFLAGGME